MATTTAARAAKKSLSADNLQLLREIKRREKLANYKTNFADFATEQIKILPKDSSKGFIPFTFNEAQRIIDQKLEEQLKTTGRVRAIILKARQMGISTYTTARVFWKSYFNAFNKSVVMAHDSATSDALFNMSRSTIDYMSDEFRPQFKKSNAKEIMFEHNDSGYRLYTAGSPEAGRGTTPTIAHLSEVAFWIHDEKILAGLFQGISQADGTEVIIESTANGVGNSFHKLEITVGTHLDSEPITSLGGLFTTCRLLAIDDAISNVIYPREIPLVSHPILYISCLDSSRGDSCPCFTDEFRCHVMLLDELLP